MADQRTTLRNAAHGPKVVAQDIMEESSTQKHRLGERLVLGDRVFRYAKAGAVNLTAGYHTQSNVSLNLWVPHGSAITEGTVRVTTSGTAVSTADQYAEGYAVIRMGGGVGNTYKIKNNNVSVGAVTTWTLYEPLETTLVITTTTGMSVTNRYSGVLVGATGTYASDPVGVPIVDVQANYYFWAQTWGPCGCLIGGLTLGADALTELILTNDTATAGALAPSMITSTGTGAQTSLQLNMPIAKSYLVRANSATTATVNVVSLIIDP